MTKKSQRIWGMMLAPLLAIGAGWVQEQKPASPEDEELQSADAVFAWGDYYRAYYEYISFIQRYPQSKRLRDAVRREMESARLLAEHGFQEYFLGVPIGMSSKKGIELLRQSLHRYPFEDFSDDYTLWIAHQLFKEEKADEARVEYEAFTKVYPSSELYPEALFQIGRCHLRKFDGIDYDTTALADARRSFRFLLDKYPGYSRADEARNYLAFIEEKEAEKAILIADFYHRRGKHRSEVFYLKQIVRNHPGTETAKQAAKRLEEYRGQGITADEKKPAPPEKK